MAGSDRTAPDGEQVQDAARSLYDRVRDATLTGVAVVVPLLITMYVLTVAAGLIADLIGPVVTLTEQQTDADRSQGYFVEGVAVVLLAGVTIALGVVMEFRYGERAVGAFDSAVESLPGVGAVYKSFRRMGDVMLESEENNFQRVVLVEFPMEDAYTMGFETATSPPAITEAAEDDDMRTLFLPLAPNPVMGGFLSHVPAERVRDVDMTVEEGMRTIVTTGVAFGDEGSAGSGHGLSSEELEQLTGVDVPGRVGEGVDGGNDGEGEDATRKR